MYGTSTVVEQRGRRGGNVAKPSQTSAWKLAGPCKLLLLVAHL